MLVKSAKTVSREFSLEIRVYIGLTSKGVRKGVGVNFPPWVWYVTKTLLPAQRNVDLST